MQVNWDWLGSIWVVVIPVALMFGVTVVVRGFEEKKGSENYLLTHIVLGLTVVIGIGLGGMFMYASIQKGNEADKEVRHVVETYLQDLQKDGVVNEGEIDLTGSYLGTGERAYEALLGDTRYRAVLAEGNKKVKSVGVVEEIIVTEKE